MNRIKFLLLSGLLLLPLSLLGQGGPVRDDRGDVVRQLNAPRANVAGLAWDADANLLWGTNRANPCRLWALNPENGEVVHDYEIDQMGAAGGNPDDAIGLGFDHIQGLVWVNQWNNDANARSIANLYDRDGRNVRRVSLPRGGHFDFCTDGEWIYGSSERTEGDINAYRIYRFNRNGEDITEGPNLRAIANHGRAIAITYAEAHDEGHFWLMSVGYISQFSVDWENNRAQRIAEFASRNNDYPHQGLTHDGFNLWGGGNWNGVVIWVYDDGIGEVYGEIGFEQDQIDFGPVLIDDSSTEALLIENLAEEEGEQFALRYSITDLGGDPDWLTIDPAEGEIAPRESAEVTLTAQADGLRPGEYYREILVEANDPRHHETVIPLHVVVVEGWGLISGQITDAADGSPLPGAIIVSEQFSFTDTTDEEGLYTLNPIPAWDYTFRVYKDNFLPEQRRIVVEPEAELHEDFALLHGEFIPRHETMEAVLQGGDTLNSPLPISNQGNGPITWTSAVDFPDELEQDPWTLRQTFEVSELLQDERLQGVTVAGDRLYIAGSAEQRKLLYVLNFEGELVDTFPQLSPARYGFTSLTWDGELLWGASERIIYGFTTEGDSVTSFQGPYNPSSSVVWDSDRDLLWLCGTTTNISACDREGNIQLTVNRRGMRTYGLGYWPEDPAGYNLYVFTNPIDTRQVVMKVNPANGDTLRVIEFPDDGGRPAACAITNFYDPYSWIFLSLSNIGGQDRLYNWFLGAKTGWISTSPEEGVLDAGSSIDVRIRFDAYGLLPDIVYSAILRFTHDAVGGMTELPVSLEVTGEGGLTQRMMVLDLGWNLISANITPENADDFAGLMAPLVEANRLILAKDRFGNFYWPAREFDGIEGWDGRYGYWLKVNAASQLRLEGQIIAGETEIELQAGWNTVGYLPRQAVEPPAALSGLADNLIIVRDGSGRFYLPAYNFSNMGRMHEGVGYQLRVREAATLIYSREGGASFPSTLYSRADEIWLREAAPSPAMHHLLILTDLPEGARLEAVTPSGVGAGRGVVDGKGRAGLTLFGDDLTTLGVEGFKDGEMPELKLIVDPSVPSTNPQLDLGQHPRFVAGSFAFTDGGWGVVELESVSLPVEFGLTALFPNPFNASLSIEFGLETAADKARLTIYDLAGRQVAEIAARRLTAGRHRVVWQAGSNPAGVYLLRLDANGRSSTAKIVLVK